MSKTGSRCPAREFGSIFNVFFELIYREIEFSGEKIGVAQRSVDGHRPRVQLQRALGFGDGLVKAACDIQTLGVPLVRRGVIGVQSDRFFEIPESDLAKSQS